MSLELKGYPLYTTPVLEHTLQPRWAPVLLLLLPRVQRAWQAQQGTELTAVGGCSLLTAFGQAPYTHTDVTASPLPSQYLPQVGRQRAPCLHERGPR